MPRRKPPHLSPHISLYAGKLPGFEIRVAIAGRDNLAADVRRFLELATTWGLFSRLSPIRFALHRGGAVLLHYLLAGRGAD
jgi:hypothetical protein